MRIVLTADHNGVELRARLAVWLTARGHEVEVQGADSDEIVDYPMLCLDACSEVRAAHADMAVVVGGSGQGELIACNKVPDIRAGLAYSPFAVSISRGNNDANVMVLGTKVTPDDEAVALLEQWLATPFKGGVHQRRVEQLADVERWARLATLGAAGDPSAPPAGSPLPG